MNVPENVLKEVHIVQIMSLAEAMEVILENATFIKHHAPLLQIYIMIITYLQILVPNKLDTPLRALRVEPLRTETLAIR